MDANELVIDEYKAEWRKLWRERIEDKVRAEGIAGDEFPLLSVEKGTVILATRDFKQLSLADILVSNGFTNFGRFCSPPPAIGGWGKFIRTSISCGKASGRRRRLSYSVSEGGEKQQLKKGGRGWLHV